MHSLAKIKTVCPISLDTGIKRQNGASTLPGPGFQPVEQHLSGPAGTIRFIAHQIVHEQPPPVRGVIDDAPHAHTKHRIPFNKHRHRCPGSKQAKHLSSVVVSQLRTQLAVNLLRLLQP